MEITHTNHYRSWKGSPGDRETRKFYNEQYEEGFEWFMNASSEERAREISRGHRAIGLEIFIGEKAFDKETGEEVPGGLAMVRKRLNLR